MTKSIYTLSMENAEVIKMSESTYLKIRQIQKILEETTGFHVWYKNIVDKVCNESDMKEFCKGLKKDFLKSEKSTTMKISDQSVKKMDSVIKHILATEDSKISRKNVVDKIFDAADLEDIFKIKFEN